MSGQEDANAARENTSGELAQPPLAKPDGNHDPDTGDSRAVAGQQPDTSTASVPRSTSAEPAGPRSDSREDGTRLAPRPRPTTADASTQTEQEVKEYSATCICREGKRLADGLREINRNIAASVERAVDVVSGVSTAPPFQAVATETGAGIIENAAQDQETIKKEYGCHKDWRNHPRCQGDEDDSSQLSFGDRRRHNHEPMDTNPRNPARDPMFEVSYDTPHALAATSSTSIFEDAPLAPPSSDPTSHPDDQSALPQRQVADNACAAADPIPEAPDGQEEDGGDPRADSLNYAVSDEFRYIYENIEARWEEVSNHLRADLNARYDRFLLECERRVESQPGACDRDRIREELVVSLQRFIDETKDQFRSACINFDEWRVAYLESEVPSTGSALRQGDQFRVQAAVFRYEVLDSLPDLDRRTRARAAELWKELVEQTDLDVEAIFAELSE